MSTHTPGEIHPDSDHTNAGITADLDTPWVPLGPGRAFKPIRFLSGDRGYVALMRVDPGTVIPPHRHTGEVHAYNLEGRRELDTGEVMGPGDYVHEPAGQVDSWEAVGDVPAIVLIVVFGAVEYLNKTGGVARRISGNVMRQIYHDFCKEVELVPLDLTD